MTEQNGPVSQSEARTLYLIGDPEHLPAQLDWIAVQRLKRMGLVEDDTLFLGGPALTPEGRSLLQKLLSQT